MPILQLPTRPPREPDHEDAQQPVRARRGRYGELEEHELIHLLDAIDDERAKARFRESVYISIIIWLAVVWFLFYGPHILFHQPYYRDPIALMRQHDKEHLTYIAPTAPPAPKAPPRIDRKTMDALRQQELARRAAPTPPAPPAPEQTQTPAPEIAHVAPPVQQPVLPLPSAPKPATSSSSLPSAPAPNFASAPVPTRPGIGTRGGLSAPSGSAGPLQAGATILSDTQGVDFSDYMRRLHADIERNWTPLIPEEVQPPLRKRGVVGIRFSILPDGQVGGIKLETTSGDVALDKAAWYAITSEGQFPRLPPAFHGPNLELRVGFFYNEEPQ